MHAVKAHVKNGRLVVDEPTTLPEGAELQVVIIDGDDLDDAERAALHRCIDESIDDEKAGKLEDLSTILRELRARL